MRRHVLRNSLLPTIAVVATQTGTCRRPRRGRDAVQLPGLGQLIYRAAPKKDFPLLAGGVLVVGVVYLVATLIADLAYSLLNPRIRLGAQPVSADAAPSSALEPARDLANPAARPGTTPHGAPRALRLLLRSKTFLVGAIIVRFWVFCAIFGNCSCPRIPFATEPAERASQPPSTEHWFGTDRLGRDVFSRVIVGARDILIVAPAATLLGTVLGTALGLLTGYFRGRSTTS